MRRQRLLTISLISASLAILILTILPMPNSTSAAGGTATKPRRENIYAHGAPNFDLNLSQRLGHLRKATAAQLAAFENLKANAQGNPTVRWNEFGGSPDVVMDFASPAYTGTPEEAGRAFLSTNAALFGIKNAADLRLVSDRAALGGHLLRFQQTFNGIDVHTGGIGLVLNKNNQVTMASGPFIRDINVNTTPTLTAEQARQKVDTELARFRGTIPQSAEDLLRPTMEAIGKQLSAVQNLQPKLGIYPTADGARLVWKVAKFSTNPHGLFGVMVDAHTGEIIWRKDFVNFQNPTNGQPFKGDIYPKYPTITPELKDQSIIKADDQGVPLGQVRATLRKFDASNMATGVNGTLTGTHALVNNLLPTKQPFVQATRGTWYFRTDDPANFEARTNEQDQLAEPAEHQDDINAFFFVTYLLEYIDDIHRRDDAIHNRIGQGDFPDDYPNHNVPLPASVHAANVQVYQQTGRFQEKPTEAHLIVLGLDNALAYNATGVIRLLTGVQTPVNANPTVYGHGWRFNDLALEGTVPYHEGMHAISSPIAGFEGDEGNAMNEGQADTWAFTITDSPAIGEYVVNSKGIRDRLRSQGQDPDSWAYIRSGRSTLKFSDVGTYFNPDTSAYEYEEHRDGEIYMSTMWDIREMLNRVYPQDSIYKRPKFSDGTPGRAITKGTEFFERIYLGSLYILGTTEPDTFVKARDAMIVADQSLFPSDPTDPAAPGMHRALIEQIFAAHEMGINARESIGMVPTISTQVSHFAAGQAGPAAPQNVQVAPASLKSLKINWSPVDGAVAYEVLKRKTTMRGKREPNGVREYLDGDASTTGWRHVAYVGAGQAFYEDNGVVQEVFAPAGLNNLFDSEYAVRAIGVNPNRQIGLSDLSGAAEPLLARQNVTPQIDSTISNVTFSGGVFAFDNTITNARGANSTDKTIYAPIDFRIVAISDPTVTVKNADRNGVSFIYNTTLPLGASAVKRIEFNNPGARMFTFEAEIMGFAFAGSTGGTGSQTGDGGSEPPPTSFTYSVRKEEHSGTMPVGEPTGLTHGSGVIEDEEIQETDADPQFNGVTYVDIPITTTNDAILLDIALTSTTAVDYDLELRTGDGATRLDRSAATENFANEHIRAYVAPNTSYVIRIIGFANVASDYKIVARQFLPAGSGNANDGTITINNDGSESTSGASGAVSVTGLVRGFVRFTVNPLTRKVTTQILR
jgi:Zn-dependent metalloprotease